MSLMIWRKRNGERSRLPILQQHCDHFPQIPLQLIQCRSLRMRDRKAWDVTDKELGLGITLDYCRERSHVADYIIPRGNGQRHNISRQPTKNIYADSASTILQNHAQSAASTDLLTTNIILVRDSSRLSSCRSDRLCSGTRASSA